MPSAAFDFRSLRAVPGWITASSVPGTFRTNARSAKAARSSTFDSLCLYRAGAYRLGSYLRTGPSLCEHLVLNRRLADLTGAKMLIDPGLVLRTPIDHSEQSFQPFAWRQLRKLLASPRRRARPPIRAPGCLDRRLNASNHPLSRRHAEGRQDRPRERAADRSKCRRIERWSAWLALRR